MGPSLYACGSNGSGQLAIGHTDDVHSLTVCELPDLPDGTIVDLVSASAHALLLYRTADGTHILLGAGTNTHGQLGGKCALWSGSHAQTHFKPVDLRPPSSGDGWQPVGIAATWTTSLVVFERPVSSGVTSSSSGPSGLSSAARVEQMIVSAGSNDFGELGHGDARPSDPSDHPRAVDVVLRPGETVKMIRGGQRHIVAVIRGPSGERVVGWGAARRGELDPAARVAGSSKGKGKAAARAPVLGPTALELGLAADRRVVDVGLGAAHTVLRLSDGTVRAWGHDGKGQVAGLDQLDGVEQVACSWNGTYVLRAGRLESQGANTHGQLLRPSLAHDSASDAPSVDGAALSRVHVPPGVTLTRVVAGSEHLLLVGETGGVWAGGWNEHGNLGVGDAADRPTLTRVPLPQDGRAARVWAGCAATWILVH